jgi:MFS family permease
MACLFVSSFVQLVFARIAAGVGESGCMPPTYSLLGDYFPAPAERIRAMAIYMLGSPIAALLSFVVGGWLNELYGWRVAFFVMGAPALLVAAVVKLTVREPRASASEPRLRTQRVPRMTEVAGVMWTQRSLRHLILATILLLTMGLGMAPWYAAFMMRTHGMGTAELGVWLGAIFGLGGIAGTLLGGYVSIRWFADNEQRQLRMSALMSASLLPCFVLFLMHPEKACSMASLAWLVLSFSFYVGPTFALMQRLVPEEMRATLLATVMLLANLIGMGIGPQIVGMLSDALMPTLGSDSLRYAMLIVSGLAVWAAYHFWCVGRTVQEDLSTRALQSN